ncbi:MAG: DUF4956 domain-containing protein [Clostridia bacterium]|nr:DUF4956 domain-containing protein [Clostridia bacterium]
MNSLLNSVIEGQLTVLSYFLCTATAVICGLLIAVCANCRTRATRSFTACLIMLPAIVETVILMVNGNVGTGIAVAGAFSLVRFRSAPGKARDIAAIFLSMTSGLACAAGYLGIAVIFSAGVGLLMVIISLVPLKADAEYDLRITVPETLNFSEVFDSALKDYCREFKLVEVKTTGMGSMYKLKYSVLLKDALKQKNFIDELRTRNGNLEIALCRSSNGSEEL